MDSSKNILEKIRLIKESNASITQPPIYDDKNEIVNESFLTKSKILMEEAIAKKKILTEDNSEKKELKKFVIKKTTPQFGDVRVSQEDTLRKTIGENIKLEDDALTYYPELDDITLNGKIDSLNCTFQFRLNSASGDGCFIWTEALCLSEANLRTVGKIRDAFSNWKDDLTQNGDLMEKLKKETSK